jgi:hypothetical protein
VWRPTPRLANHRVLRRLVGEHTLRTVEGAVLRALGKGTVEERVEGRILDVAENIVLGDKQLESLATVRSIMVSKDIPE